MMRICDPKPDSCLDSEGGSGQDGSNLVSSALAGASLSALLTKVACRVWTSPAASGLATLKAGGKFPP